MGLWWCAGQLFLSMYKWCFTVTPHDDIGTYCPEKATVCRMQTVVSIAPGRRGAWKKNSCLELVL